jgi:hypothetical protein
MSGCQPPHAAAVAVPIAAEKGRYFRSFSSIIAQQVGQPNRLDSLNQSQSQLTSRAGSAHCTL